MKHLVANARDEYTFLAKANLEREAEVANYIDTLYIRSLEDPYYTESEILVPTRHSIFTTAWTSFEEVYIPYIMNGGDPFMQSYFEDRIEEGLSIDEISDDIADTRMNNASYGLYMTDGRVEKELLIDVYKGLDNFNYSYYLDNGGDNMMLRDPENLIMGKWKNRPIQKVW